VSDATAGRGPATSAAGRTYRLAPPDRTGALLGLGHRAVAALASGLAAGVLAFSQGAAPLGFAVGAVAVALVTVRFDGGPLIDTVPVRLGWLARRHRGSGRWAAPVPLPLAEGASPPWPAALDGQELMSVPAAEHGIAAAGAIGVVHDRPAGTVSATLCIAGRHFGLVDAGDQDALVARWGQALAGLVRERTPIVSVRCSEWAAPAGVAEHLGFIDGHCHEPDTAPARAYRDLVAEAGPTSTGHEVLVTLTVGIGRAKSSERDLLSGAVATLGTEVRTFSDRLANAGLTVSAPLGVAALARATRCRLDPTALAAMDRRGASLGKVAGMVRAVDAGPLATDTDWTWWRADGSYHRCFYVADWPRSEVPADWMGGLLSWAGAIRSITVVAEPVSPRQSRDAIRRQATKLESDREHRQSKGFRVGAALRRTEDAVAQREEELVSGYPEFTYAGIVTVTAATLDALERASDDLTQVAGGLGMDLRALHGRHDRAFALGLPLGRGLAPPARWGPK
jgi:hypothetical protein